MGDGRGIKAPFPGLESPAIVHNELAVIAGFVTFDVSRARFPRESLAATLDLCLDHKEKSARLAK